MEEWDKRKKETPELNRQVVLDKVLTGFHVGVLAYQGQQLLAWISVSPVTDTYWFWKRSTQLGVISKTTAGIACITINPEHRSKGMQSELLKALIKYGKEQGWTSIEGYPFDENAYQRHGHSVSWSGNSKGYEVAGFIKTGPHWLSQNEWERSIFEFKL